MASQSSANSLVRFRKEHRKQRNGGKGRLSSSPRNAVILAVIAGAAPEGAVILIEVDGRDRAGGFLGKDQGVAHAPQFAPDP